MGRSATGVRGINLEKGDALVAAVERSWYGASAASDPPLPALLETVRASLTRCAPPGRRARLLPRSVLPRRG